MLESGTSLRTVSFPTDSHEQQIDWMLIEVTRALQLPHDLRQVAEREYRVIGEWVSRPESGLWAYDPTIYAQGSMSYGTTVKPRTREEFDLDAVVELSWFNQNPLSLLRLLQEELSRHPDYSGRLELLKRCVRIRYDSRFHIDVLPGRQDEARGGSCIEVPDRKLRAWSPSNPMGFRDWFEKRAQIAIVKMLEARGQEPIPDDEAVELKAVLKQVVQLVKRHRDIVFEDDEGAPRSIVLTTLAGEGYGGQRGVLDTLLTVLDSIVDRARAANGAPFEVLNPMNPDECFSEAWKDARGDYHAFVRWIIDFRNDVAKLRGAKLTDIERALSRLFGERVARRVISAFAESMRAAADRNNLRMTPTARLSTGATGLVIPDHRFHGAK